MTTRFYICGTDTGVGKTSATAALFAAMHRRGLRTSMHKPVQSFGAGDTRDTERLNAALRELNVTEAAHVVQAKHEYSVPRAPGLIEQPEAFTSPPSPNPEQRQRPIPNTIAKVRQDLEERAAQLSVTHQLIEGAGGLFVPMPGSTWQLEWIEHLADHVILIAAPGLGTINHSVLTALALKQAGQNLLGFVVVHRQPTQPDTTDQNIAVIEQAISRPCLGRLPYLKPESTAVPQDDNWLEANFWNEINSPIG